MNWDLNSVTPKKRKHVTLKPLQDISLSIINRKSSNKKPLKRRLSISDEEEMDHDHFTLSAQKFAKNCWLLKKFREVDSEDHTQINLEDLPWELHRIILSYLPSQQLLKTIQLLSTHWRQILLEPCFWQNINIHQPLNLSQRWRKIQLLAERRSKGKQFKAANRMTNTFCSIRKILLDVTNAGQDDGLPTSVLRELSYLKSLNHSNVTK